MWDRAGINGVDSIKRCYDVPPSESAERKVCVAAKT